MKTMPLLFVFLLLTPRAFAASPLPKDYSIRCGNSVAGATFYSDGQRVHFELIDSAGFQDLPIYNGTVTPLMLSSINQGALDLKELDGHVAISWDASRCTYDPKRSMLFDCSGAGEMTTPKTSTLKVFGIASSTTHEEMIGVTGDSLALRVTMFANNQMSSPYFLIFNFATANCQTRSTSVAATAP